VCVQARSDSSPGWVYGGCEREVARGDDVLAAMVKEKVPVGEMQDVEVSHARGAAVAMDAQVKASQVEAEDAMLLEVARRHACGSLCRSDPRCASRHARTQRVLRDGRVRWNDESELQTLWSVKGVKVAVHDEPFACWTYHHLRQRHGGDWRSWFEWARPKDCDG